MLVYQRVRPDVCSALQTHLRCSKCPFDHLLFFLQVEQQVDQRSVGQAQPQILVSPWFYCSKSNLYQFVLV